MVNDRIEVSVWRFTGSAWHVVGELTYEHIEFETRFQDVGTWAMTLPFGVQSDTIKPGRLVTTKFRGTVLTWVVSPLRWALGDNGLLSVTVGGFDAVSMLGWPLAWPNPSLALTLQPREGSYSGPAETAVSYTHLRAHET